MKKIFTLAMAAIALAACTNETEGWDNLTNPITIDATMASESRAATKDAFAAGDAISVYAWTGDAATLPSAYVVENSTNTFDGTKWTASPQMLWKDGTTAHHFIGICPVRAISDTEYALADDGDLMVAITKDVAPSSNPVSLAFDHLMAKLRVNLTFRNQWTETPAVTSVTATGMVTATINYLAKTVKATGDDAANVMTAVTANTQYEALMVPQECKKVSIVIGDKTYTYNGSITLASGKVATLNLNVGRSEITLEGITVNPWTDGATVNGGEAEEE